MLINPMKSLSSLWFVDSRQQSSTANTHQLYEVIEVVVCLLLMIGNVGLALGKSVVKWDEGKKWLPKRCMRLLKSIVDGFFVCCKKVS